MDDIREKRWHEWNIDLALFADGGVDLSKVSRIIIGFGEDDGIKPGNSPTGLGEVYFEDIKLYTTRCVLAKRSPALVAVDFAPGGAPSGDCIVDYREMQELADGWLAHDSIVATHKPDDTNLVVYYPLNEADGNAAYDGNTVWNGPPDPCNPKWTGTLVNTAVVPPSKLGTSWAVPGVTDINGALYGGNGCIYMDGSLGSRVQCGIYGQSNLGTGDIGIGPTPPDINAITLSIWAKWLGPRIWSPDLYAKGQGLLGKRGGWTENTVIWTFWISAENAGSFGFGHFNPGGLTDNPTPDCVSPAGVLNGFIGKWVHLAATFPHPSGDANDANSYAKIYLNGGEANDGPWKFTHGNDKEIFLTIGQTNDQNGWPDAPSSFYGYLDEVRIYNRVLEANEIAYLADTTPDDNSLQIPVPSSAEVYYYNEPIGSRKVDFKDFSMIADKWLYQELWP
jgi:hypothetical protein